MSISKESKKKFIEEFSKNENDTGSTAIQIAVITERITPHSKPDFTSETSSLNLFKLLINPLWITILSRSNLICDFREIYPSFTIQPAILPILEILNTSLISTFPVIFSDTSGFSNPDNKFLTSSINSYIIE